MQNLNDLLNGYTDGTKDLSINALTCAGAVQFDGNTTIGSSSTDTLTVLASLASSIPIGTTFSYDIGANATGLRYIFLGSADSAARSVKLAAPTIAAAYVWTFPTSVGTNRYALNSTGSVNQFDEIRGFEPRNLGITATINTPANGFTIALKGADGNDPSSTNVVDIPFRSATAATGTPVHRTVTSALSIAVTSGSTLGHTSGAIHYIYVYAIDDTAGSGGVVLGVSSVPFDDGVRKSTTAENGSSTSPAVLYTNSGITVTSKAIRLIARITSNQASAGTWTTAFSNVALRPFETALFVPYAGTLGGQGTVGVTSESYLWRKLGDCVEIKASAVKDSNAGSGSANLSFALPTGMSKDTTKLPCTTNYDTVVGTGSIDGTVKAAYALSASDTVVYFSSVGTDLGASKAISARAVVPISGW